VRKGRYQYYLKEEGGRRKYIRAADIEVARSLAQRDYDQAISKILQSFKRRLKQFVKLYDIDLIENEYSKLPEARRRLVRPVIIGEEEYVEEWYKKNKGGLNTYHEQGQYMTDKGEYVRSKSEKIIADLFYKYNVPYVYETRYELEGGIYVYPDFITLNIKERRTVYWEHFGLISDGDYAKKTLYKLNQYELSGLIIGEDLLFSMESETSPLNVKEIENKIKKYLL